MLTTFTTVQYNMLACTCGDFSLAGEYLLGHLLGRWTSTDVRPTQILVVLVWDFKLDM